MLTKYTNQELESAILESLKLGTKTFGTLEMRLFQGHAIDGRNRALDNALRRLKKKGQIHFNSGTNRWGLGNGASLSW